jgi:UPF0755 protein
LPPLDSWRKRPWRRLMRAVGAAGVAAVLAVGVYLYWVWHHPLYPGTETYVVKPGTSMRALARQLEERDVIAERYTMTWLGFLTGRSRQLKAGEYRFRRGISAKELLDQIVAGRVVEYPLVILEGWNFRQMMRAIEGSSKLTKTLTGLSPSAIMQRLGHPELHPEGRFYPDTYYYSAGTTDLMILTRAFERMQKTLQDEWDNRDSDVPLKNMNEALTLASIIEKETGNPDERRLVAGVFVNRLRRGMRLQTDPTIIYGLGETFDGNIRLTDLRRDNPYNTYTRKGLPPTPIAMPGGESISAALHPDTTDAIFFVARGDGSHVFSATLEDHNAAVNRHQRRNRPTLAPTTRKPQPSSTAP